jgi:diguanylate cyclase (GGDEF)-like protein
MAGVKGFDDIGSDELFQLVWRDDLTGLYNRRFFARYMKQVADWAPGAPSVALAMVDMDNLKRINDRLGHMHGDAALKRIGQIMLESLPPKEEGAEDPYYAIRYAGDEFVLVFPNTGREQALEIAEDLRKKVVKDEFTDAGLPEALRPSLSVGIAVFPADAPAGGDDLTEAADNALYHSKRTGKNKVTCAADLRQDADSTSDAVSLGGFPSKVLVGRDAEFRVVDEVFALAHANKNAFLLLEGAGGTGKTRLLSEIGKYARERGCRVLIDRCSAANREEPYKTIGRLLDAHLRGNATLLADVSTTIEVQQKLALSEILKIFKDLVPRRRGPPRRKTQLAQGKTPPLGRRPTRNLGKRRPPPTPRVDTPRPLSPRRGKRPPSASVQRPSKPKPNSIPDGRSRHPTSSRVRPRLKIAHPMNPAELTAMLFKGLMSLLKVISKRHPVVILLDDLASADEPTLEVIKTCLPLEGKVIFIGCARTDAAAPDPETNVLSAYGALRKRLGEHANAHVITLEDLDNPHTTELATHLLEGFRPPPPFAERIFALSKGNPLFVEGVLRHLVDTDKLSPADDGWNVAENLPDELPLTLETLLRAQLKVLSPDLARLLEKNAIVGPNFEFNVLQASLQGEADEDEAIGEKVLVAAGAPADASLQTVQRETTDADRQGAEAPDPATAEPFAETKDRKKRDRFLMCVRERQDMIFDREAVENLLLDSRKGKIPEVTEAPPSELFAALPVLAKHLATTANLIRRYEPKSKVVKQALTGLVSTLKKMHQMAPAFTIAHRGNAFVVNGVAVDKAFGTGKYQEAVVGIYRANSIKSLTFADPPQREELLAFLGEAVHHSVQVDQLERYYWAVFSTELDLQSLGIAQKSSTLKRRDQWSQKRLAKSRIAERNLELVQELVEHFMASIIAIQRSGPGSPAAQESLASLYGSLTRLFEKVPALAIHEGVANTVVVNGTSLAVTQLGSKGPGLRKMLRVCRLQGMVLLKSVEPKELAHFVTGLARITPHSFQGQKDPTRHLAHDESLPNVLIGDALFQLAHDLVRRTAPAETVDGGVDSEASLDAFLNEYLPLPEREDDLPTDFEWPSDAVAKRARALFSLQPAELLDPQGLAEYVEVLEALLIDDRGEVAKRLLHRMAVNFASTDQPDRVRAAELFLNLAQKASQELRGRYFELTVVRLADAIELETDFDVFERLADCAKLGILDRIAEADWDVAARLVWSLGRRRDARAEAQAQLKKVSQRIVSKILSDPRSDRIFETIETGSQQERRKAARVLEGMGVAAVDRLVRALKSTQRSRVEHLLIEMLAALAPESDAAIQKAVTPSSPADETRRLLRASAVVCQDPTPVLVAGLQNEEQIVQTEAVSVARSIGHNVAQNVLRWALAHGSAMVQLEAVKHLGELSRPDTADGLLELLQSSGLVEVQRECCLAFGKMALNRTHHEKVVPVLTNFLRAGGLLRSEYHQDVRAAAAWALGQMKTSEGARRALERALDDKDKRVRLTARLTLEGRSV